MQGGIDMVPLFSLFDRADIFDIKMYQSSKNVEMFLKRGVDCG